MAKLSFLLLIFLCVDATAQSIAEGSIVSKTTGKPIPYVNIYFKSNSWRGTISNPQGNFKLRLPTEKDSIIFSHVSFKRKTFSTEYFSTSKKIYLEELEKVLAEIIVMPDSTLRQLLRKAFKNIESNYPTTGTLAEGFYRETNKLTDDNQFIYFSESTIQFYKPSYSNRNYGPVRIIEGSKAEVVSRNDYSNVKFYAGVYSPQRLDFVKQRMEFINPSSFNLYDYSIESIMKNDDREIVNISFKPKAKAQNKAEYEGYFQLDRKTLAYIGGQFDLTSLGLRNHTSGLLINIKDTRIHYDVRYREENDVWNLSSLVYDGDLYNPKYKNNLRHTSEFITTSIKSVDSNPIKEQEAIPYTGIYTDQQSKFSDDYWNRADIIARDSTLEKEVKLLFAKKDLGLKEGSREVIMPPTKFTSNPHITTMSRFALTTTSDLSFGFIPIKTTGGLWSVNYANTVGTQRHIDKASYLWFLDTDIGYKLNRSFTASLTVAAQVSQSKEFGNVRMGIDYRKRLGGWRLPFYLQAGLGFGTMYIRQTLGKVTSPGDFTLNKKKFVAGKDVEMLIGQNGVGLFPSLQLNFSVRPRLQLYAGMVIYSAIATHDRLIMRQRKNFLSTKTASTGLDDPNVNFSIDGSAQQTSALRFTDLPAMFRIGIALRAD